MTQAIITKNAKLVADNIIVGIEDPVLRKRLFVYANIIETLADFMTTIGFATSTKESLYKNTPIAKNFDIADFYIGSARVDVRVIDNSANVVLIPKSHQELGIEPDLYMVVKIDDTLKSIDIVGFIPTDEIIFDKEMQNFFILNAKKLLPIDKFKQLSTNITVKKYNVEMLERDIFQLFLKIQEEELSPKSQKMLLHSLLADPAFLRKLNTLQKIDSVSKNLSQMPDLFEELSPIFVEDFADDDLGGMDNIEEVEIFGDEKIIEVPQNEIDEVLDELNPDPDKDNPDLEPFLKQKQENKPLILHVLFVILLGAILIGIGLSRKNDEKIIETKTPTVIDNAVIPEVNLSVNKLAWGISSDLSQNTEFVNYLNESGQIIKEDLSKELQVTTETPKEKELKVAVVFDNNAGFKTCLIKTSSGSKEVDDKTLNVIKNVFEKNPSQNIRTSEPFIRTVLIINL